MKALIGEVLTATSDFAIWQSLALIIFMTFLAAVALWVIRPGSRQIYDEISQFPLADQRRDQP